jgi:protein-S-isoprenylcysteine O-methyltransferase Ste14
MTLNALELRIPPVALLLVTGAAMWAVTHVVPSMNATPAARLAVAVLLGLSGLLVALAGVREFRRARTTLHPQRPDATSSVVRTGIYAHSRNPMYLGMLLVLVAWGAWLANLASLALAAAFVPYLNRFQIEPEERAMARNFGAAYEAYRRQVRRWL